MVDQKFQNFINKELNLFFQSKLKNPSQLDKRHQILIRQIADLTLRGGKRLRPYFCSLGFSAFGGDKHKSILPALLALELFHTFALIHDDIIDQGNLRRGGPTIHAYFTQNLRKRQLADSLALLAGDLCLIWAYSLWQKLGNDKKTAKAHGLFFEMGEEVILGQTSDVWGMQEKNQAEILEMYKAKSGNYSVQKPLVIGALLAGATVETRKILSSYGEKIGLALQLTDDLLDIFGQEEKMGKRIALDIVNCKWTYLTSLTASALQSGKRKKLFEIYINKKPDKSEILWVKKVMIETGARAATEKFISNLVSEAKMLIQNSVLRNRGKLVEIADFILTRSN